MVKTVDGDKSDLFYNDLLQKTKEKDNVETAQPRKPKIKIMGVGKKYDTGNLIADLKQQNHYLDETDELEIVHQIETRRKDWIIIVETAPKTFHKMIGKTYVNIG